MGKHRGIAQVKIHVSFLTFRIQFPVVFKHESLIALEDEKNEAIWFCQFSISFSIYHYRLSLAIHPSIDPTVYLFELEKDGLKVPLCLLLWG